MTVIVEEKISITANIVIIENFGTLTGTGKGFSEEEGPGYLFDTTILEYPSPTYGKPGGSHGGIGGMQGSLKFGEQGSCYGKLKSPVTMGSGEFFVFIVFVLYFFEIRCLRSLIIIL